MNSHPDNPVTGAVVIGRNEGERLKLCLNSLTGKVTKLVYVDSGSADASVVFASGLGVGVVELDTRIPFTAARARNEGFAHLLQLLPEVEFVQFVDGDCEVVDSWMASALAAMTRQDVAVVFGRRKERYPNASIYNTLCDIEWDIPIGERASCGGDVLIRVSAFKAVHGYNAGLIAGEEPEMCVRLRRTGWKIFRIDAGMTLHDANMMHFSQWWKRTLRAGHAYAEGASLHGKSPEKYWVKEVCSNWFWGLSLPVILILAPLQPMIILLVLVYPLQIFRIYKKSTSGRTQYEKSSYAIFCVLAKLPLMLGQIKFRWNALMGKKSTLIEYK
jgi:GT2 family glycosyltransferase